MLSDNKVALSYLRITLILIYKNMNFSSTELSFSLLRHDEQWVRMLTEWRKREVLGQRDSSIHPCTFFVQLFSFFTIFSKLKTQLKRHVISINPTLFIALPPTNVMEKRTAGPNGQAGDKRQCGHCRLARGSYQECRARASPRTYFCSPREQWLRSPNVSRWEERKPTST